MDILDFIKMKKFQFYQMMQKPIPDKELKITSEKHEKHIELIGWRWSEKNLRNLWLFTLFLLFSSIIKIGYHYSNFLVTAIPESR